MDSLTVARVRADLAQKEVAARLGVDVVTLWRWEQGRSVLPAWALLRLAELYGVDPRDLALADRPARVPHDVGDEAP